MPSRTIVALASLAFGGCAPAVRQPAVVVPPKLVVFITVDQLLPDYYDRWKHQLNGGLALLYREGAVFQNGYQDHAIAETAPGHASTMSGRFPVHTGIASNSAGVADPATTLIGTIGIGASPHRFRGTTLTDWLLARDPSTRVLSVSRKDRGAILPIGRSKAQVFWYSPARTGEGNGAFVTSSYYTAELPQWVRDFNARRLPHSYAGKPWDLLLPASAYTEADSVPIENLGRDIVFPHVAPADSDAAAFLAPNYPWIDDVTLQLALEGVNRMELGAGRRTDVLAISLSGMDGAGHAFGPDSREVHDYALRLDRMLGTFLDSLFKLRGRANVIVALTADHGVAPFIDVSGKVRNPHATRVFIAPVMARAREMIREAGGDTTAISFGVGALDLDRAKLGNVNVDAIVAAFADSVKRIPGVLRVDRPSELARQDTVRDHIARRWLHMFASDDEAALVVTLTPYSYWGAGTFATHGTPHDYDVRVPVIFFGAPFRPGMHAQTVRVVDMAPTLARVLGVTPLERLDGVPLGAALR
ncbi:MAG TPA: alkaline phosphatase family protein [Gemmatimonadaceae bacterium]|nr:alkaline phosphatase family protein [Gemmatimonadaceae bacterium]